MRIVVWSFEHLGRRLRYRSGSSDLVPPLTPWVWMVLSSRGRSGLDGFDVVASSDVRGLHEVVFGGRSKDWEARFRSVGKNLGCRWAASMSRKWLVG